MDFQITLRVPDNLEADISLHHDVQVVVFGSEGAYLSERQANFGLVDSHLWRDETSVSHRLYQ